MLGSSGADSINDAAEVCRQSGYTGWQLAEYAQKLVAGKMKYSYSNSFDFPTTAFKKGKGYCWHQSGALNKILKKTGLDSRLVYAAKNRFPDKMYEGVLIRVGISGHVWCRVKVDGVEKDVCPGSINNRPGYIHFEPVSTVKEWNSLISIFAYIGSAFVNARRLKEVKKLKKECARNSDPENCTCKKKKCPRYRNCKE